MPSPRKPYRVLIIDDSAVVRQAMQTVLSEDPDLEIMGAASDPIVAAERIKAEIPDVITLDIEMPRMDGITFLRRLMAQRPIPVVMCSSLVTENSTALMQALEAGAVEIILKPQVGTRRFFEESQMRICDAVKAAAQAKIRPGGKPVRPPEAKLNADVVLEAPTGRPVRAATSGRFIAIGASTGGTEGLRHVLSGLPANCPPVVIVQHMPGAFTPAFAERLNRETGIRVKEAKSGDRLEQGLALLAPGDQHMLVNRTGSQYSVELRDGPLVSRHRPSVDVLFRSVATCAGKNAVGVIMTGMGDDGAKGLMEMRQAGARTLGQNEETCVVYGMPRAAQELGAVEKEVSIDLLARQMMQFVC